MPVLRTRGSFRRYFIEGAPIDPSAPETYAALRDHAFRPIDDAPVASETGGWVSPWDPTGREIREEDVRFGARLALALRLDRKRVPGSLVKIHAQAEERTEREVLGVEHLAKKRRLEIRQRVEAELLARALPSVALHQVFVDTQRRVVLLQGTSDRLATTLAELFQRTFGRGLREATAGPLAEHLETDPQRQDYIQRLGPLLLMPPPRRLIEIVPFTAERPAPASASGSGEPSGARPSQRAEEPELAPTWEPEDSALDEGEVGAAVEARESSSFGAGLEAGEEEAEG